MFHISYLCPSHWGLIFPFIKHRELHLPIFSSWCTLHWLFDPVCSPVLLHALFNCNVLFPILCTFLCFIFLLPENVQSVHQNQLKDVVIWCLDTHILKNFALAFLYIS
jgi:hypothetical protein